MEGEILGLVQDGQIITLDDIRAATGEMSRFRYRDFTFTKAGNLWWMQGAAIGSFRTLEELFAFVETECPAAEENQKYARTK